MPNGLDCAECVNDRCESGYLSKCIGGVYQNATLCESNECASETACTKECEDGDHICKDGKILVCVNEHYTEDQTCEFGCDKTNTNACASSCEEGAKLCTEGQIKECIGGKYSDPKACENNYSCSNDTECGECINNEVYCVDDEVSKIGSLRTCRDGKLNEGFKCNDNHSCNSKTNMCGACKNGERRCINDPETQIGHIQVCEDGEYTEEKLCDGEFSCQNETAYGNCLNNTQTCTNDENELGTEHICINGTITDTPCEKGNSCDFNCLEFEGGCDKNKCGNCRNGFSKCGETAYSVHMLSYCVEGNLASESCNILSGGTKPYCMIGKTECTETLE